MNPSRRVLLFVSVLLAGCGAPTLTPPVTMLAESPAVVDSERAAELSAEKPSGDETLRYTVRKAVAPAAETIPPVLLSGGHTKLCQVKAGDDFPALRLPRLGGPATDLATLRGKQATVVLFWHPDRWMARTALIDMQRDVANQFDAQQVAVVGIAVREPTGAVQASLNQAQVTFPQLLDTEGQAFAKVGSVALPRLYVLDPTGKIAWFDIEYSEGTRRELWQTLRVLTKL